MHGISKRTAQLIACVLLAGTLGLLSFPSPASADRLTPESDITMKEIRAGDMTASGHTPSLSVWFPGYGDYALAEKGSYLYLEYDHSPLARPEDSTLTVLVNGVPLSSVHLTQDNAQRTGWKLDLPPGRLTRTFNKVELRYYMRIRDDDCPDQENPALWSTLYDTSVIHYEYASPLQFLGLPDLDLGRFPEPFIRPTVPEGEVAFVVPDDASSNDLSAAASVAARFGQASGGKQFKATLYRASQVDARLRAERDLVVVGHPTANTLLQALAPSLPLKYRTDLNAFVDASGAPIGPDSGVLQLAFSPWDQRFAVLVVSGASDEAVQRASRAVASRLGMKQMQGPYAVVTRAVEELRKGEDSADATSPTRLTLDRLGLQDFTGRWAGEHTVNFSFDAAPADPREAAYLDLVLSSSPILDTERSSVTISLNGVPVRSFLARVENSQRGVQRVMLPTGSLRPGVNSMTVRFNLYVLRAWWCGPLANERAWAVLHSDSALVLPFTSERPPLDLANFPYPFVQNGTPSSTYLVLPDDAARMEDGLQVAVALGKQSLGASTEMRAGFLSQLTEDERRGHEVVAYGLPETNRLIAEVGQRLPLVLEGGSQRSLQTPQLVLLGVKDAANLGAVELVPSPWNADRALLVVSGTSSETARRSSLALGGRLPAGNVAVASVDDLGKTKLTGIKLGADVERAYTDTMVRRRLYSFAAIPMVLVIVVMLGVMVARSARD